MQPNRWQRVDRPDPASNPRVSSPWWRSRWMVIGLALALVAAALPVAWWLAGDDGVNAQAGTFQEPPFSVWEEQLEALRSSPDNLPARADKLVDEGDPEAIFTFVRDEIATLPPTDGRVFYDGASAQRWGVNGTILSGAGTPREKVDLLAYLLDEAGFQAQVVVGEGPPDADAIQEIFLNPVEHAFDPQVGKATAERWLAELGGPPGGTGEAFIDPTGSQRRQLADDLWQEIEDEAPLDQVDTFSFRWSGDYPSVRVVVDGENVSADPLWPNATFGEPPWGDVEDLEPAEPSDDPLRVRVSLQASTTRHPGTRDVLAEGNWTADELVGRQLTIQLSPALPPTSLLEARFSDVRQFIPTMLLQGTDLEPPTNLNRSVIGAPVDIRGQEIGLPAPTEPTDAAPILDRVDHIEIERVDTGSYPDIRLWADVTDAEGTTVPGVPATAFNLTEDGKRATVSVDHDRSDPTVAFLYDTSTSMPDAYSDERMDQFVTDLTASLEAAFPDATIHPWETDSKLWDWLSKAATSDATVVVYATDGEETDDLTPRIEQRLTTGPPAVLLDVEEGAAETFEQMANLTGGTVVPAADQAAAVEATVSFLEENPIPPYQLSYTTPNDGMDPRTVSLVTADGEHEAETTYEPPPEHLRAVPPRMYGLYLTVEVGDQEVTRTLAGYDELEVARMEAIGEEGIDPALVNQTLEAIFGVHVLRFDGTGSTLSQQLTDQLSSKLAMAHAHQALVDGREADALREMRDRYVPTPPEVLALGSRLPDWASEDAVTYPNGLRTVLFQERPVFGTDRVQRRVDLLPLSDFHTVAQTAERTFKATLERTAMLAVAEANLLQVSTRSMLDGLDLVDVDTIDRDWKDPSLSMFHALEDSLPDPYPGSYMLTDADASTHAIWQIREDSGELLGILSDGSGGASGFEQHVAAIERIDLYLVGAAGAAVAGLGTSLALRKAMPGGAALGAVAGHGARLVGLFAQASIVVQNLDSYKFTEAQREELFRISCEVFSRAQKVASVYSLLNLHGETTLAMVTVGEPREC